MSNTQTNPIQLFPTNEIVGAMLPFFTSSDELNSLEKNAKEILFSKLNLEVSDDFNISVLENTSDTVNLVLPFYSQSDEISAKCLKDSEVKEIAGGEIIGLILFALAGIGSAVAATVAPTVIVGATAAIAIGAGTVAASVGTAVTAVTAVGVGIDQGVKASKGK